MTSPRQPTTPLLALHGFTGSGADFQWLASQTADLFCWHTPDLPGHGKNADMLPKNHSPAAITTVIDSTLAKLATAANKADERQNQPALTQTLPLLLGYSMGGRMALRYLARYGAQKISGLILIGASAGLANSTERRARRGADHALAARIEANGINSFIQYWNRVPLIASQQRSPHFEQLQLLRRGNSAAGLARSLRHCGTGALAPVHGCLPKINVPCLLLTGQEDAKFTVIATELANAMPTARHVRIPDAGHSPHWENPQFTEATLRTWMASNFPAAVDSE